MPNRPTSARRGLLGGWLALLALGVLSTTAGCSKSDPTPEQAYKQFHKGMTKYAREPYPGYRMQAWERLSSSSQAQLEERAKAINERLPDGIDEVSPDSLIRVRRLRFDVEIEEMKRIAESAERVELEVRYKSGSDRVVLVLEDDLWKVDLFAPTEDAAAEEGP